MTAHGQVRARAPTDASHHDSNARVNRYERKRIPTNSTHAELLDHDTISSCIRPNI